MPPPSRSPLRVLFVTPEIHPLVKTGGLGDVSGALPQALAELGVDVRVLVPGYPPVLERSTRKRVILEVKDLPGFPPARLLTARSEKTVPLIVIDCPPLYRREGGPYLAPDGKDWPDNALRFALLGQVAALLGSSRSPLAWRPHVLHCNDWQAGLAPAYLHFSRSGRAATVMTIHNLAFQGIFPAETVAQVGLPPESFSIHGVEYYGQLSFLKAGLYYADRITTVSPTYAREIQSEPLGFGLHGLLAARRDHLIGILNGIDTEVWDPSRDPFIAVPYSSACLERKRENKAALQRDLGLPEEADTPLLGMVSRITTQKGVDLVVRIVPRLVQRGVQLALLGSGDKTLEQALTALGQRFPRWLAVRLGYDESLSHRIEAGADMFLMPSRFEPCGLNQMYSQRYGTPPVVHATGGLRDSVTDATPAALADGTATGFVFEALTQEAFLGAIDRGLALWHDPPTWRRLQRAGMARDFSWKHSAREYLKLYRSLVREA
ncbi:glycogen synthase GlgA [Pelomicrobium methylotrophicum]|uniref:Glycogen synthase n=1 Tax=Pelomicrobium methylotrophicum TaxID=2602750 RepID=A0A5C7EFK4_9PROT|nr:glycogen synthase GlgA [Pelomicrobium methylotrophicum]TXF10677.1 glycogen synthase GlgA [Pelomicrobium methylotrophicum]